MPLVLLLLSVTAGLAVISDDDVTEDCNCDVCSDEASDGDSIDDPEVNVDIVVLLDGACMGNTEIAVLDLS